MSKKLINLFIDELGVASPKDKQSNLYILSGIMVTSKSREELRILADQIKYKYWNRTDIIFHSREIGRKGGVFDILEDEETEKNFYKDLLKLLNQGSFQLLGVIVDKTKMPKNWNEKTIYLKTSEIMVRNFILALIAQQPGCRGKLTVESATAEKDFYFLKVAGFYLSRGFEELGIDFTEVQKVLTEISFVTKKNFDIEEQIADLLAYGMRLKFKNIKADKLSFYEKKLIEVVDKKLFKMNDGTKGRKKKLHSQIESFKILELK